MVLILPSTICSNLDKGSPLSIGGTYGTMVKFSIAAPIGLAPSPGYSAPVSATPPPSCCSSSSIYHPLKENLYLTGVIFNVSSGFNPC